MQVGKFVAFLCEICVENSGFMWAFLKQQCDFWQDNSSSYVFPTLLTQHKLIRDSNIIVVLNSISPLNALGFFLVLLWRTNYNHILLYIDHKYIYIYAYICNIHVCVHTLILIKYYIMYTYVHMQYCLCASMNICNTVQTFLGNYFFRFCV